MLLRRIFFLIFLGISRKWSKDKPGLSISPRIRDSNFKRHRPFRIRYSDAHTVSVSSAILHLILHFDLTGLGYVRRLRLCCFNTLPRTSNYRPSSTTGARHGFFKSSVYEIKSALGAIYLRNNIILFISLDLVFLLSIHKIQSARKATMYN